MEPPDGASRERYMYRRRSTCAPDRCTCAGILPEEIPPEYLMIFIFSNLTIAFNNYSHTIPIEGLYS